MKKHEEVKLFIEINDVSSARLRGLKRPESSISHVKNENLDVHPNESEYFTKERPGTEEDQSKEKIS